MQADRHLYSWPSRLVELLVNPVCTILKQQKDLTRVSGRRDPDVSTIDCAVVHNTMSLKTNHISVCICTYKRPLLLGRLLRELVHQETKGLFTYSIVVADNDYLQSAKAAVSEFATSCLVPVRYCVEPQQNIALARNKAIETSDGDFIAFIDDDEFPTMRWLLTSFQACNKYNVDGVVGPVKRHFDEQPPTWVIKGRFYERPTYRTGLVIDWQRGRTNNVLLKRGIIPPGAQPFRPEFRTGEDQDFFRRMIEQGHTFIWCDESVVFEAVLPVRWRRSFMIKRALLQGTNSVQHPGCGARNVIKTIVAIVVYTILLPIAFLLGQHKFMKLVIKLADHAGRLLALIGVSPIKEQYVTE